MRETIEKVCQQLKKNEFTVKFFETEDDAVADILRFIPMESSVARCGSVTCTELGLFDDLKKRGNKVIDPYETSLSPAEKASMRKKLQTANILLTGTNAITMDGKLVNIDGVGNRVALQIFGPDHVIIVAGVNKIAEDVPSAIKRIKSEACPQNARRLELKTPCAQGIPCPSNGCESPDRMCRATVILEKRPRMTPITIYLIDKSLGY